MRERQGEEVFAVWGRPPDGRSSRGSKGEDRSLERPQHRAGFLCFPGHIDRDLDPK